VLLLQSLTVEEPRFNFFQALVIPQAILDAYKSKVLVCRPRITITSGPLSIGR